MISISMWSIFGAILVVMASLISTYLTSKIILPPLRRGEQFKFYFGMTLGVLLEIFSYFPIIISLLFVSYFLTYHGPFSILMVVSSIFLVVTGRAIAYYSQENTAPTPWLALMTVLSAGVVSMGLTILFSNMSVAISSLLQ